MSANRFDQFLAALGSLRCGRAHGVVTPYKPVLLLAVILLIDRGKIRDRRIVLDGGLKSVFEQVLYAIFPRWPRRPDARQPFRHLENDGVWLLTPLDADEYSPRHPGARGWDVLSQLPCAELGHDAFEELASARVARRRAAEVLVATYLPSEAQHLVDRYLKANPPMEIISVDEAMTVRGVEEYLSRHWRKTPFATEGVLLADRLQHGIWGRQMLTPRSSIDLLGVHPARKELWAFELTRGQPAETLLDRLGASLEWIGTAGNVGATTSHGVLLAGDVDEGLRQAVESDKRLNLWTYDAEMTLKLVA